MADALSAMLSRQVGLQQQQQQQQQIEQARKQAEQQQRDYEVKLKEYQDYQKAIKQAEIDASMGYNISFYRGQPFVPGIDTPIAEPRMSEVKIPLSKDQMKEGLVYSSTGRLRSMALPGSQGPYANQPMPEPAQPNISELLAKGVVGSAVGGGYLVLDKPKAPAPYVLTAADLGFGGQPKIIQSQVQQLPRESIMSFPGKPNVFEKSTIIPGIKDIDVRRFAGAAAALPYQVVQRVDTWLGSNKDYMAAVGRGNARVDIELAKAKERADKSLSFGDLGREFVKVGKEVKTISEPYFLKAKDIVSPYFQPRAGLSRLGDILGGLQSAGIDLATNIVSRKPRLIIPQEGSPRLEFEGGFYAKSDYLTNKNEAYIPPGKLSISYGGIKPSVQEGKIISPTTKVDWIPTEGSRLEGKRYIVGLTEEVPRAIGYVIGTFGNPLLGGTLVSGANILTIKREEREGIVKPQEVPGGIGKELLSGAIIGGVGKGLELAGKATAAKLLGIVSTSKILAESPATIKSGVVLTAEAAKTLGKGAKNVLDTYFTSQLGTEIYKTGSAYAKGNDQEALSRAGRLGANILGYKIGEKVAKPVYTTYLGLKGTLVPVRPEFVQKQLPQTVTAKQLTEEGTIFISRRGQYQIGKGFEPRPDVWGPSRIKSPTEQVFFRFDKLLSSKDEGIAPLPLFEKETEFSSMLNKNLQKYKDIKNPVTRYVKALADTPISDTLVTAKIKVSDIKDKELKDTIIKEYAIQNKLSLGTQRRVLEQGLLLSDKAREYPGYLENELTLREPFKIKDAFVSLAYDQSKGSFIPVLREKSESILPFADRFKNIMANIKEKSIITKLDAQYIKDNYPIQQAFKSLNLQPKGHAYPHMERVGRNILRIMDAYPEFNEYWISKYGSLKNARLEMIKAMWHDLGKTGESSKEFGVAHGPKMYNVWKAKLLPKELQGIREEVAKAIKVHETIAGTKLGTNALDYRLKDFLGLNSPEAKILATADRLDLERYGIAVDPLRLPLTDAMTRLGQKAPETFSIRKKATEKDIFGKSIDTKIRETKFDEGLSITKTIKSKEEERRDLTKQPLERYRILPSKDYGRVLISPSREIITTRSEQRVSTYPREDYISRQSPRTDRGIREAREVVTTIRPREGRREEVKAREILRASSTIYPFPREIIRPPFTPPKKIPSKTLKKKVERRRTSSEGFYVFTKKSKKPLLISKTPLRYGEALALGKKITKSSARASFELVAAKRRAGTVGLAPISELQLKQAGYRKPIKAGRELPTTLRFVQRRATRLGTAAEVRAVKSYRGKSKIW